MQTDRILVVDDDPAYLFFAELALGTEFRLITVEDSRLAVAEIQTIEPDLIFLDLMMPYVDGVGICEELNESHPTALPKVIINTANPSNPACTRLIDLGVHAVVMKLADAEQFVDLAAKMIDQINGGRSASRDRPVGEPQGAAYQKY